MSSWRPWWSDEYECPEFGYREAGKPLHATEIPKLIIEAGLLKSDGKTPEATVSARLYSGIKSNGDKFSFVKVGPQTFALRDSICPLLLDWQSGDDIFLFEQGVSLLQSFDLFGSDDGIVVKLYSRIDFDPTSQSAWRNIVFLVHPTLSLSKLPDGWKTGHNRYPPKCWYSSKMPRL